jgi:Zn-dependent protease with chaperone function
VFGAIGILLTANVIAAIQLYRTGIPFTGVILAATGWSLITYNGWRSGADVFLHRSVPASEGRCPPAIRDAVFTVCEQAGCPVPRLVMVKMDTPGAAAGFVDGDPVIAVDPLLQSILTPEEFRAIFAHEIGHLERNIHTDAIRALLPQGVGFGVFWTVALAGQSPTVALGGSLCFVLLALSTDWRLDFLRYALGLGAEPLALAVSRYANRQEEFDADRFATEIVPARSLATALYTIAAIATGVNHEDIAGPVPWKVNRSLRFCLFATHPPIETRVRRLECNIPEWAKSYHPNCSSSDGT